MSTSLSGSSSATAALSPSDPEEEKARSLPGIDKDTRPVDALAYSHTWVRPGPERPQFSNEVSKLIIPNTSSWSYIVEPNRQLGINCNGAKASVGGK